MHRDQPGVHVCFVWESKVDFRSFGAQLASLEEAPDLMSEGLAGRTVLIGASASGSGDFVATPTDASLPGVLVTYNLMNTILTESWIVKTPAALVWGLTICVPLLLGAGAMLKRPMLLGALTFAAVGVLLAVAVAQFQNGVFIPIAPSIASTFLAGTLLTTSAYAGTHRQSRQTTQLLKRFVSPALMRELQTAGTRRSLPSPQRCELTVLFVDIAGFTPYTEDSEPEEVSEFLARFYEIGMEHLVAQGGTLDSFPGDAMLAYFGSPVELADKEDRAVAAALAIREQFDALARRHAERRGEALAVRCGITTGYVSVGYFGGEEFATYGIVGRGVNLAARLQTHAGPGEILLDRTTATRLSDRFEQRELEPVSLKGIPKPVELFMVEGTRRESDHE